MRNLFVTTLFGTAALALAAPALGDPGGKGGGGGGNGNGKGGGAPAAQGGGQGKGGGGNPGHGNGGGGNSGGGKPAGGQVRQQTSRQHASQHQANAPKAQRGASAERGHQARPQQSAHAAARPAGGKAESKAHGQSAERGQVRAPDRPGNNTAPRFANDGGRDTRGGGREQIAFRGSRPAMQNGCPPGLAKKYNGCNPPGLVRQQAAPWQADWWGYRDDGYRYYDGYLVRTSGSSILGYVPLLGGALFLGEIWPSGYDSRPVPAYYSDYYDLGPDYRYYDDTFYRLEPRTGRIDGIAGFLTGDEFIVGRRLPMGYDVYNVPWEYRDRYYDGPEADYRYADGYVYRVDPRTQLILAVIQLLS